MKTLRLEQRDSYQATFAGVVTALEEQDGALWVALAESCFYPESGGQPADGGTLNGLSVQDVQISRETVWHRLESSHGLEPGQTVTGELDWPRRYRHMQRHSAQHLLSQAFVRVNEAFETRSVSLSGPVCTLDLAGEPDEDAAQRAETLTNEVAYRNLPIRALEIDEGELPAYRLRRPPKVSGRVRLVLMGDWEVSACGGTHLRGTAEALPVKVLGWERIKKGLVRVRFSAGLEALDDYRHKHEAGRALTRLLSVPIDEAAAQVGAVQQQLKEVQARLEARTGQVAALEAERLLRDASSTEAGRVVAAQVEPELLQSLAAALCAEPDVTALLGAQSDGHATLLFMRGASVQADMNALLQRALPSVGGRGGGRPDRAQGGGERVEGLAAALAGAAAELEGHGAPSA